MLNLDSRTKSKLVWVGTLLLPALAVQGVRFMVGGSPAAATAATTPAPAAMDDPASLGAPARALTPAQAKAAAWLKHHSRPSDLRSPMDRPDPIVAPPTPPEVPKPEQAQAEPAPPAPPPAPTMSVSGMIAGSGDGRHRALINHRLCGVGDEIVSNWKIVAIDAKARTVSVVGPEGQTLTLGIKAPAKGQ